MLALKGGESADAAADHDAEAAGIDFRDINARVFHGHFRGCDGKLDVSIRAPCIFGDVEIIVGVEIFHFASDFAIEGSGVQLGDGANAAAALLETRPGGGEVVAKWGDTADAGDDDASFAHNDGESLARDGRAGKSHRGVMFAIECQVFS